MHLRLGGDGGPGDTACLLTGTDAPGLDAAYLRAAAAVIKGRKVASTIKQALVVAGSGLVKKQAKLYSICMHTF